MKKDESLPIVSSSELALVKDGLLNQQQLKQLFKKTPKSHIYKRKAKGGGDWEYVTGTYMKKVLNLLFGWDWDFEIVNYEFDVHVGQAIVQGRLTCRVGDRKIVKMQFGRADIKFKTDWSSGQKQTTDIPLDLGNDLKAAATDALKKCASELGVASDVYAPNEFKAINVVDDDEAVLEQKNAIQHFILSEQFDRLLEEDKANVRRIVELEEVASYPKVLKIIKNLNV